MWQTYSYEKRTLTGVPYWLVTREKTLGKGHPKGGASVLTLYDELKCVTPDPTTLSTNTGNRLH